MNRIDAHVKRRFTLKRPLMAVIISFLLLGCAPAPPSREERATQMRAERERWAAEVEEINRRTREKEAHLSSMVEEWKGQNEAERGTLEDFLRTELADPEILNKWVARKVRQEIAVNDPEYVHAEEVAKESADDNAVKLSFSGEDAAVVAEVVVNMLSGEIEAIVAAYRTVYDRNGWEDGLTDSQLRDALEEGFRRRALTLIVRARALSSNEHSNE